MPPGALNTQRRGVEIALRAGREEMEKLVDPHFWYLLAWRAVYFRFFVD
jgi:hypothetical protein